MEGTGQVHRGRRADANGDGNGHGAGAYLGACAKHFAERAVIRCDDCGELWCAECTAPAVRKRAPTRCIACALVAAGVRAPGPRRNTVTSMSRQQRRPNTGLF